MSAGDWAALALGFCVGAALAVARARYRADRVRRGLARRRRGWW